MEGKARIIRLVDKAIDYYVALRDKRCDAIAVRFDNHEEVPALIKCMEKFDTKRVLKFLSYLLSGAVIVYLIKLIQS